jgi:hypothetical protein
MSRRTIIYLAAAAAIGVSSIATDAFAWRGGGFRAGVVRVGGVYHGGIYRRAYVRRGVGVAVAAPYYYGRPTCGYYPYSSCY